MDNFEGTINGWPVSLTIERDARDKAFGARCAPHTDEDDSAPDAIVVKCHEITGACYGLKPRAALRKATSLGFRVRKPAS